LKSFEIPRKISGISSHKIKKKKTPNNHINNNHNPEKPKRKEFIEYKCLGKTETEIR